MSRVVPDARHGRGIVKERVNLPIELLGAEKQAATSIALAYPERSFVFVTDHPVVDGWDLPNASFRFARPDDYRAADNAVVLCPRWASTAPAVISNRLGTCALTVVFAALAARFPDWVLPVAEKPGGDGRWIVKGDTWHRPDFTITGTAADLANFDDPYGCGVAYQPFCRADRALLPVGRRFPSGRIVLGVFEILGEAQCREAMLVAAESLSDPGLVDRVVAIVDHLDHRGFFSMNWIAQGDRLLLTSMRPIPRAVLQALRHGGADVLIEPVTPLVVTRPAIKLVARQHYAQYRRLAA